MVPPCDVVSGRMLAHSRCFIHVGQLLHQIPDDEYAIPPRDGLPGEFSVMAKVRVTTDWQVSRGQSQQAACLQTRSKL